MSGSGKSEQEHVPHFLHKKVKTRKFSGRFTLQSCKSSTRKCTRKCAAIRPIVVFHSSGQGRPTFNFSHFTYRVRLFFVESKKES